ncbi:MAG: hypothetical protein HYY42_00180, partial [Chloroflexi bacterium]|nr:hypothetical protein [Chloroflexota bacterium]
MRTHPRSIAPALLAVLATVSSACGGTTQPAPTTAPTVAPTVAATTAPTVAPTVAVKPGELDQVTIDKAKAEGKVVLYTSLNEDDAKFVITEFNK